MCMLIDSLGGSPRHVAYGEKFTDAQLAPSYLQWRSSELAKVTGAARKVRDAVRDLDAMVDDKPVEYFDNDHADDFDDDTFDRTTVIGSQASMVSRGTDGRPCSVAGLKSIASSVSNHKSKLGRDARKRIA